jgi:rRNA maturation endonuclease Nob1
VNCPLCGGNLAERTRRRRAAGSGSCLLELIGLLLILFTWPTVIGPIIGVLVLILGHNAAYVRDRYYRCRACQREFPGASA